MEMMNLEELKKLHSMRENEFHELIARVNQCLGRKNEIMELIQTLENKVENVISEEVVQTIETV